MKTSSMLLLFIATCLLFIFQTFFTNIIYLYQFENDFL